MGWQAVQPRATYSSTSPILQIMLPMHKPVLETGYYVERNCRRQALLPPAAASAWDPQTRLGRSTFRPGFLRFHLFGTTSKQLRVLSNLSRVHECRCQALRHLASMEQNNKRASSQHCEEVGARLVASDILCGRECCTIIYPYRACPPSIQRLNGLVV